MQIEKLGGHSYGVPAVLSFLNLDDYRERLRQLAKEHVELPSKEEIADWLATLEHMTSGETFAQQMDLLNGAKTEENAEFVEEWKNELIKGQNGIVNPTRAYNNMLYQEWVAEHATDRYGVVAMLATVLEPLDGAPPITDRLLLRELTSEEDLATIRRVCDFFGKSLLKSTPKQPKSEADTTPGTRPQTTKAKGRKKATAVG